MNWYFDAYIVTDYGSGWDEIGGPYSSEKKAREAAERYERANDDFVDGVKVYPRGAEIGGDKA